MTRRLPTIHLLLFALAVLCPAAPVAAEDKPAYTPSEYKAYLKAHEASGLDEKEAAVIDFLDWHGKSTLLPNVLYELQVCFEARLKNQETQRAEETAKRLLAHYPVARDLAERVLAKIRLDRGEYGPYLDLAEAIYARNPVPRMAAEMVLIADKAKDKARCEKYAALVEQTGSSRETADLFFTLSRNRLEGKDDEGALAWARRVAAVLDVPEKPADFTGEWETYQVQVLNPSLGLMGMACLKAQDYPGAIAIFDKILAHNPREAVTYYWRAAAHVNRGEPENALPDFARAAVLKDETVSIKALEMVQKILEARGEDPSGAEAHLDAARTALGMQE
ncbi:MAG: tetratricopeptide repeat protein [Acidobacteria bacterium]|nr:tetratricopeptide repeat protein [Acidobacteriota bacterium]